MASELDRTVQAAHTDLLNGKYLSIRVAAAAYSLNNKTLANRINYGLNRRQSHSVQQILSLEQEEMLVQWILDLERQGHAPTHKQVREMAQKVSVYSGGPTTIGVN
jgi:Tc5 transposase DNA-binding domain